MNKLQLYIYKSLRGFKSVRNLNPSEHVQNHIRDFRGALEHIDYNPAEKQLFYLISYIDEGCFFTILRTIPDVAGDHLASTIFIPSGLDIPADALSEVVDCTAQVVSNPSVSAEDMGRLQELFSREYRKFDSAAAMVASQGREYAVCLYGGTTGRSLDDFFKDCLYQTDYLPYSGVLLVDQNLNVGFDCDDVTGIALRQPVELLPPEGEADGFTPHLFHHVFNRPFLVSQGSEVDIVWRRGGFEEKVQTVTVDAPDMSPAPISGADCRKTISPASFYITSQQGKGIVHGTVVSVNGIVINEPKTFTLAELKSADVHIAAPGYAPFRATLDLASTTQALVQLQEQRKVYRFELPVRSTELGSPIHFEIHTKRDLTDSPVEGYRLIDDIREGHSRTNHLEYVGQKMELGRRQLVYGGIILLAGIILGWIGSAVTGNNEQPIDAMVDTTAVVESAKATPVSTDKTPAKETREEARKDAAPAAAIPVAEAGTAADEAAISYLDNNTVWTREGMEAHPALRGLFDDMNNFRMTEITGKWASKLSKSKRFEKVAHHAGEGMRKKVFSPSGKYCREGDTSIAVQTYLNTVDPAKPAK